MVQLIREHFGYHPVHIFTLEPGGDLLFRASTAQGEALERLRTLALHAGNGIMSAAAASGELVLAPDVREDPRYIGDDWHTRLSWPCRYALATRSSACSTCRATRSAASRRATCL